MDTAVSAPAARPILGLHHFAWRCKDAEATRHFYEDILGLPLVHVIKNDFVPSTGEFCPYVHIFFRMHDGSSLAFFDLGDDIAALPSPNTPGWVNHIAVRVAGDAELQAMRARLIAYGIEVIGVIDHDGYIHSIYFFDPNGFRLEITAEVAAADVVDGFAQRAHAEIQQWNQEKAVRRQGSVAQ
ncbi:glyoxalase [Pandoraea cepalis]|uniref:Glyoxalase n=1 Tax=Pandoraea cepalis TaxID=2508294 RepID=A0AAW7MI05_9BURK|nr:VOC family protein [Pandoraea cepalis]MDN4572258.1 glyoxalase [Pandoraea cepalis]MDN4576865.1 glyoxalase [Pandoraea cepalis]